MSRRVIAVTTLVSIVACGGADTALESEVESAAVVANAVPVDHLDLEIDTIYDSIYDDDPKVEFRINGDAAAITENLLPQLSAEYGLNYFTLNDERLVHDTAPSWVTTLLACHNSDSKFEINMNDIEVRSSLDADAVKARFKSGPEIETDLDLPHFELEFELQFKWDHLDSWYCNAFGTTYDIRVQVNVDGVSGELDLLMRDDQVAVDTFDKFKFDVDSVSFDSSFLTAITNIGLTWADVFGAGCGSSLTDCVNNAIDDNLENRAKIRNAFQDAIEDAIARVASIDGAANVGGAKIDYAVSLDDLTASDGKDRLRTKWDVDFSTDEPDASCAQGLSKSRFFAPADRQTNSDVDVMIPFKKITDLMYVVAKQGDLCAPFLYTTPRGAITVDVKPNGSFRIEPVILNVVRLSLPVAIEAADGNRTSSSITATLEITASIVPTCDDLSLTPLSVQIAGATGTMTYQPPVALPITLDATTFINTFKSSAEARILAALGTGITIAPEALGVGDLSHVFYINDLEWGSSEVTIGLDLFPSSSCD